MVTIVLKYLDAPHGGSWDGIGWPFPPLGTEAIGKLAVAFPLISLLSPQEERKENVETSYPLSPIPQTFPP